MMKRSGKFYRKNEKEVMEELGLQPTKNSGSGWIEKEDGQSDKLICQLKSTDAMSISLKRADIDTLEHNAAVAHKIPLFALQFLSTNDIFLCMRPEDIFAIAEELARTAGNVSLDNSAVSVMPSSIMSAAVDGASSSMTIASSATSIRNDANRRILSDAIAREMYEKEVRKGFSKERGAF